MVIRARAEFLDIDTRAVEGFADRLARLSGGDLNAVAVNTVNTVAERTEPILRESILETINLSDNYLRERIGVTKAEGVGGDGAVATISAVYKHTPLTRYMPQMITVAAKSPLRKLKGNAALGIARGQKLGGITVEVTLGARKPIQNPTAHFLPGLTDSSGNPLIATRTPSGAQKVRYGPSVYQLFRVARDTHLDQIDTDLRTTLLELANEAFTEELG